MVIYDDLNWLYIYIYTYIYMGFIWIDMVIYDNLYGIFGEIIGI